MAATFNSFEISDGVLCYSKNRILPEEVSSFSFPRQADGEEPFVIVAVKREESRPMFWVYTAEKTQQLVEWLFEKTSGKIQESYSMDPDRFSVLMTFHDFSKRRSFLAHLARYFFPGDEFLHRFEREGNAVSFITKKEMKDREGAVQKAIQKVRERFLASEESKSCV